MNLSISKYSMLLYLGPALLSCAAHRPVLASDAEVQAKWIGPEAPEPPRRVKALSIGDAQHNREAEKALEQLTLPTTSETSSSEHGASIREGVRSALNEAVGSDLVVLDLAVRAQATGERIELLGEDGAVALSLDELEGLVRYSPAGFLLIALDLRWEGAAPGAASRSALRISGSGRDVLVLLNRSGDRTGPGGSALWTALSRAADTSGDGLLSGSELLRAAAASGFQASGAPSRTWALPLRPEVARPPISASPSRARPPAPLVAPARTTPAPRVPVQVCLDANDGRVPLEHTFHTGDRLRLTVQVSESGYLALGNRGPTGNIRYLYPDAKQGDGGRVTGGVTRSIPSPSEPALTLSPPTGAEQLVLVWSREEIEPEAVIALLGARPPLWSPVGPSQAQAVAQGAAKRDITNPAIVADPSSCGGFVPSEELGMWIVNLRLLHE